MIKIPFLPLDLFLLLAVQNLNQTEKIRIFVGKIDTVNDITQW